MIRDPHKLKAPLQEPKPLSQPGAWVWEIECGKRGKGGYIPTPPFKLPAEEQPRTNVESLRNLTHCIFRWLETFSADSTEKQKLVHWSWVHSGQPVDGCVCLTLSMQASLAWCIYSRSQVNCGQWNLSWAMTNQCDKFGVS